MPSDRLYTDLSYADVLNKFVMVNLFGHTNEWYHIESSGSVGGQLQIHHNIQVIVILFSTQFKRNLIIDLRTLLQLTLGH